MRPDIAATAFSHVSISFLNAHRGTLVRKPFAGRTLVFKGWHSIHRQLFHSNSMFNITAKLVSFAGTHSCFQVQPVIHLQALIPLHCCIVEVVINNHLHQKGTKEQWSKAASSREWVKNICGAKYFEFPIHRFKVIHYQMCAQRLVCYCGGWYKH